MKTLSTIFVALILGFLSTNTALAQSMDDSEYPSLLEEETPAPQERAAEAAPERPSFDLTPPPRRQRPERFRTPESRQAEYCRYLREQVIPQSRMSRSESQDLLQNYRCQ